MRRAIIKYAQKNSFWLSLLLHALLILYVVLALPFQQQDKDHDLPNLSIPAYTYQEPVPASSQPQVAVKKVESAPEGIEKAVKEVSEQMPMLGQEKKATQATEPINLIGNKKIKKPLLELLGKALARTLVYPKIAMDFNLRGIAYIGFTMQPDGQLFDVQLVKTSGTEVLDQAALAGVSAVSPVNNVSEFLKEKKYMVVGIIFK